MTVEKSKSFPSERPPAWWHNALRNNLEGNMVNAHKFSSSPKELENGYSCALVSITAQDPDTPMPEGIYFVTDIPADKVEEAGDLTRVAGEFLSEPFSAELAKISDVVPEQDILIDYHPFLLYERFCLYLLPAKEKAPSSGTFDNSAITREMESSLDAMNEKIFSNLSEAEKVKLLFDPTFPEPLKRRFLEVELVGLDSQIKTFLKEGIVTRESLRRVAKSEMRQNKYRSLMRGMAKHETEEEAQMISAIFAHMDAKTYIGWVHYYIKYWDKKYGCLYQIDYHK